MNSDEGEEEQMLDVSSAPSSPLTIEPLSTPSGKEQPPTGSKRRADDTVPEVPEKKAAYDNQIMNEIDYAIEKKKLGESEFKQHINRNRM